MAEISKFGKTVLALTAGFALFCGGWFSCQLSGAEPYPVTTQRRPALEEISPPDEAAEGSDYPDSLLPGERIDINTADVYDLQRLPGIGEKRAQDIIDYRESHGPFQTLEELTEVYGIGPGILENLRDYATVGSE